MNGKRHLAEGVKWPGNPGHLARRTSCSGSALGLRISRSTLHQSLAHIHANASLVIRLMGTICKDLPMLIEEKTITADARHYRLSTALCCTVVQGRFLRQGLSIESQSDRLHGTGNRALP
ncbi:MAG TPA: hypothetical protein VLE46_01700 [Nitrospira sp.]|nr:hypothetical protein [Nitrospira sp.]